MGRKNAKIDPDLEIDLDAVQYESEEESSLDYIDELQEEDDTEPDRIEVEAPSGASYTVLGEKEESHFNELVSRYMSDNRFTNVSDLQDLDGVVLQELFAFRYRQWLLDKVDYHGMPIDEDDLHKRVLDISKETRLLKKALNMDKSSRDRDKGKSIDDYWENLKLRAREFGYKRNEESVMAITLWKELQGVIQLHSNATERERRELESEIPDIINWLLDYAFPKFDAIDENFRKTSQKYWVRDL